VNVSTILNVIGVIFLLTTLNAEAPTRKLTVRAIVGIASLVLALLWALATH